MEIKNAVGVNVGFPEIANALLAKSNLSYRQDMDNLAVCFGPRGSGNIAHALRAKPSTADKPDSTTYVIHPVVFESHGQDARYTGPHNIAPAVTASFGMGGGNISVTLLGLSCPDGMKNETDLRGAAPDSESSPIQNKATRGNIDSKTRSSDSTTYVLQGSMINRKLENGPQGSGINENISFTLNTKDRHAVAYLENVDDLDIAVLREMIIAGFMAGQGAKAGSIGYREELSPTLKAGESGTNQVSTVIYPTTAFAFDGYNQTISNISQTIRSGKADGDHVGMVLYLNQVPTIVYPETARTLTARHDSSPCVDRGQNFVVTYNITFCDANGIRSDRPDGGLYVNETDKSNTVTAKSGGYETAIVCNTGALESMLCVSTGQPNAEILNELCPTLNCAHEQPYIVNKYIVRRLTPLECERLMGLPDGWTEGLSDSARYKALGNSLAIPCAEYVLEGIARILNEMS